MKTSQKSQARDMTQGSIWKQLLLFSLPLMAGNLFQQLYNTVDSIVVGNFVGKEALAAVGSVGPICNSLIGFFMGLSTDARCGYFTVLWCQRTRKGELYRQHHLSHDSGSFHPFYHSRASS